MIWLHFSSSFSSKLILFTSYGCICNFKSLCNWRCDYKSFLLWYHEGQLHQQSQKWLICTHVVKTCVGMDIRIPCNRVHHSFTKLERILILMIQRAKVIKIEIFHFYNTFQHFGSNVFLATKMHEFGRCVFNKKLFICMWKNTWMHNIHDVSPRCNQKIF